MKVRLMKIRGNWVPRELYESNFVSFCVARESSWVRHQVNMADIYNTAERRKHGTR